MTHYKGLLVLGTCRSASLKYRAAAAILLWTLYWAFDLDPFVRLWADPSNDDQIVQTQIAGYRYRLGIKTWASILTPWALIFTTFVQPAPVIFRNPLYEDYFYPLSQNFGCMACQKSESIELLHWIKLHRQSIVE